MNSTSCMCGSAASGQTFIEPHWRPPWGAGIACKRTPHARADALVGSWPERTGRASPAVGVERHGAGAKQFSLNRFLWSRLVRVGDSSQISSRAKTCRHECQHGTQDCARHMRAPHARATCARHMRATCLRHMRASHARATLIVKSIAELHVNLSWVVIVESSKGQAVVEQHAAIRHVQSGQRDPVFPSPKLFPRKCRTWCAGADSCPGIAHPDPRW